VSVARWSTREPLDRGFERAWRALLHRAPSAHFGFDPAYLLDRARRGEHAIAVRVEERGRRGALVLRERGPELVSGWPWRCQAVVADPDTSAPLGLSSEQLEWLWAHAERLAGARRLRFFGPQPPTNGTPWFVAGSTCIQSLGRSEEELSQALDPANRRMIKRALAEGSRVLEAKGVELFRSFAALPRDLGRAPGALDRDATIPPPGEGFREWEKPWMWLLVAVKDGRVEAGSGFGLLAGATIDYRANASTPAARKDGANVLLAWEAVRLGRERGFRWLNWGGATRFKQEFGGERVQMVCGLGGGPAWRVPNLIDAAAWRARSRMSAWLRTRNNAAAAGQKAAGARHRSPRPRPDGTLLCWRTRNPLDPGFERAWIEVTKRAPLANFELDLAYLSWEGAHGRHSMAVLSECRGRRGALVLREARGAWVCGWPWRWVAAMEDVAGEATPAMPREYAEWLFAQARRAVGRRRLKFYLPAAPPSGIPGFEAGATVIQSLEHSDEELLAAMHASKRRMVRRAVQEGYATVEGSSLDHFRAFGKIQRDASMRRGQKVDPEPEGMPQPGEAWREWELPWMWLLLAVREGRVQSGLGDGMGAGAMLECRTGASTPGARKAGAFPLLCHEEARRARDRGFRWLNHGGDSPFKCEVAGSLGTRLVMCCWLGGGSAWSLAHRSEAWSWRARMGLPAWVRSMRARGAGP
jgi:hypothetical protein